MSLKIPNKPDLTIAQSVIILIYPGNETLLESELFLLLLIFSFKLLPVLFDTLKLTYYNLNTHQSHHRWISDVIIHMLKYEFHLIPLMLCQDWLALCLSVCWLQIHEHSWTLCNSWAQIQYTFHGSCTHSPCISFQSGKMTWKHTEVRIQDIIFLNSEFGKNKSTKSQYALSMTSVIAVFEWVSEA